MNVAVVFLMSSVLSVHKGAKLALSLCVCRMPSMYAEPEFAKKFRLWKEEWESQTNSKLNIADGLAYLKTPGHFLPSIEERQKRLTGTVSSQKGSNVQVSEIEELLSVEGIPELSAMVSSRDLDKDDNTRTLGTRKSESNVIQSDSMLYLIVRYAESPELWTFPFAHRLATDSAFMTLKRICSDQLGIKPHFPSLAPMAFRKLPGAPESRLFYYKGVFVPKTSEVRLPAASGIVEYAWVSRDDLRERLAIGAWKTVRDILPLD